MTELEKCMAGEYYNCHDEIFLEFKQTARKLLKKYHELQYEQKQEKTEILKIPDYNGLEDVNYMLSCTKMPERVTIREWDISQLEETETAEPSVKVYAGQGMLPLKPDKIYELVAEWPEENLKEQGFFGEASYVVVTD